MKLNVASAQNRTDEVTLTRQRTTLIKHMTQLPGHNTLSTQHTSTDTYQLLRATMSCISQTEPPIIHPHIKYQSTDIELLLPLSKQNLREGMESWPGLRK